MNYLRYRSNKLYSQVFCFPWQGKQDERQTLSSDMHGDIFII